MSKVKNGNRVKDSVSGFTGVATARCKYLTGCIQFEVTGEELIDGKIVSFWLDDVRLKKIKAETPCKIKPKKRGGSPKVGVQNRSTPPSSYFEEGGE